MLCVLRSEQSTSEKDGLIPTAVTVEIRRRNRGEWLGEHQNFKGEYETPVDVNAVGYLTVYCFVYPIRHPGEALQMLVEAGWRHDGGTMGQSALGVKGRRCRY
jgi:hypothetical protein